MLQFRIFDGRHDDSSRADQAPRRFHLGAAFADQMEQLGQDGFGCQQRKPELLKRIDTDFMPAVRSVQHRQNGPGVDQRITVHYAASVAHGLTGGQSPPV